MPDDSVGDSGSSIDNRHLLLVGAGPGLGLAVARRFADGGYQVTLVARSTDGLGNLADSLANTGAQIDTIAADASDPEGLRARMAELYNEQGAYVYRQLAASDHGKQQYAAVPVKLLQAMGSAWLVQGVDSDDVIVASGAGVLWSLQGLGTFTAEEEDHD